VVIPLGLRLPAGSSDQPDGLGGPPLTPSYLVLLRMGFTELPESPPTLVRSYRTLSPLVPQRGAGLLSVALSLGSPPPAVSRHPALCSPDFPPVPTQRDGTGDHPAGFDPPEVYHAAGANSRPCSSDGATEKGKHESTKICSRERIPWMALRAFPLSCLRVPTVRGGSRRAGRSPLILTESSVPLWRVVGE